MVDMSEPEKEEKPKKLGLSVFYRLLLKLPKLSLESLPQTFHGVFYSIILPIFVFLNFLLTLAFLVFFPFPINLVLTCVVPVMVFLYFAKSMVERFISWYQATFGKPMEWNVKKAADEYIALLEKQKSKKNED